MVPHWGTVFPTQKVSPYYRELMVYIVWTDFLGRDNGSTMWNQTMDKLVPHCGTVSRPRKSVHTIESWWFMYWLTLWVKKLVPQCGTKLWTKWFHIVESFSRPRKSVWFVWFHNLEPVCYYIVFWFHIAAPICFNSLVWFYNVERVCFGSTLWNQSVSTFLFGSTLQNQFVVTVWFGSTMWNHIP